MKFRTDCLEFLGDRPCKPHKLRGRTCNTCPEYVQERGRLLLVKLGALGDVVRTLPLLEALSKAYAGFSIWVVTQKPSLPFFSANPFVRRTVLLEHAPLFLSRVGFQIAANLDLDPLACGVVGLAQADQKLGFGLDASGNVVPLDERASTWYAMSLDDPTKRANHETYQQHMARILGVSFKNEPIRIEPGQKRMELAKKLLQQAGLNPSQRPLIGLNTGSSGRWPLKAPPAAHFVELIRLLDAQGLTPVSLLGGHEQFSKNQAIANAARKKAVVLDVRQDVLEFAALVAWHNLIVTGDTLALHLALAFKVRVVAMFGPTSAQEIELYGFGTKLVGDVPCIGCYTSACDKQPTCMDTITPKEIFGAILNELSFGHRPTHLQRGPER